VGGEVDGGEAGVGAVDAEMTGAVTGRWVVDILPPVVGMVTG
jgi:hypothetical protein